MEFVNGFYCCMYALCFLYVIVLSFYFVLFFLLVCNTWRRYIDVLDMAEVYGEYGKRVHMA